MNVTLDEKGRISLPVSLRKVINETTLFLTEGLDDCLWLYTSAKWDDMKKTIMDNSNPFSAKSRVLRRRLLGPSQEIEIDKAGRIPIPQSLRDFAGLEKDCVVLGQDDYIEIWDKERYFSYKNDNNDDFIAATEEVGLKLNSLWSAEK
jgi:MraZ protein